MNYIRKILIGRIFKYTNGHMLIILGVKRSDAWIKHKDKCSIDWRYYEILVGRVYMSKFNEKNININAKYEVEVYAWNCYYRPEIFYFLRSEQKHIRNCMRKQPNKINKHKGIILPISNLKIFDKYNLYSDYKNTC